MKWFFPAFNGDFRLVQQPGTVDLVVHEPTLAEQELLAEFFKLARKEGWVTKSSALSAPLITHGTYVLDGDMTEIGLALKNLVRPETQAITAFKYEGGKVEVVETADSAKIREIMSPVPVVEAESIEDEPKKIKKATLDAAVSVRRPDRGCPDCSVGAIEPASEVLLEFLTPEQHESWRKHRAILVRGGESRHEYVLMHRHSRGAAINRRVCFDLTERRTMMFHDWSVPPEEEVLASKLVLEHRESWLTGPPNMTTDFIGADSNLATGIARLIGG